jgi:hypothetical protein
LAEGALSNQANSGVILGRATAGVGPVEELTLSQALDLIGSAAQGDLIYRGSAGWQRLPAGTSGQFLKTLGAGADPAWDTPSGGGGGSQTLISEVITSASQASVSFISIPPTYRDLRLVVRGRGTAAVANINVLAQFNSDTGSNYDRMDAESHFGASVTVGGQLLASTSITLGYLAAASSATSAADAIRAQIYDYRGTTFQKALTAESTLKAAASSGNVYTVSTSGWWRSTSAINRIDVSLSAGAFVDNSVVSLYGVM